MRSFIRLLALIGLISLATALDAPSCGPSSKCPESAPCCSAYGQCGAGAYCLGGCDPMSSFNLNSCMPRPTCSSAQYTLDSRQGLEANTLYLGDPSDVDWVTEGNPTPYDGTLLLTMPPNSVGTLLSSSHYVWYGKISVTMRSSAGQGVITAFIMMSDVKDEIDFEFVGADLQAVQSNFYWQGVKNYTNSMNLTAVNTNTDWHTYEIDWQEDSLTWSVDGKALRTLYRKDTIDPKTGVYRYPQTPARIQLSLWPAGTTQSAPGTIAWAGGLINWNSPYMANGYYYAQIKDVTVQCAPVPSGTTTDGSKSYQYTSYSGLQSSVEVTNDNTILGSFLATGNDQNYDPSKNKGSSSGSGNSPHPSNVQTVPGVSGAGARGDEGSTGSGHSSSGSSGTGYGPQTFSQGLQGMAAPGLQATTVKGSAFAALIAFIAILAF